MSRILFPLAIFLAIIVIMGGCSGGGSIAPSMRGDDADNSLGIGAADNSVPYKGLHPYEYMAPGASDGLPSSAEHPIYGGHPLYKDNEVLVVLNDGVDASALYPVAKSHGLSLMKEIKLKWAVLYKLHIDSDEAVERVVEKLKTRPEVRYAEPNIIYYPTSAPYYPNDPMFEFDGDSDDDPWSYKLDQWGPNVIGASLCWPVSKGSADVAVAVLDTGIRWSHEDLANQIWTNEDEIPDNGIDDDDNGYIDDCHGWDFAGDDGDTWDTYSHGTGCSGVVVAEQDNSVGMTGVAPGVKVMPLRTALANDEVIEGAQYAYDNGAAVVSMSFHGYSESEIMHQTFIAVWDNGNGMLPCASAGNDNSSQDTWPNSWPEVLRVGATCSYYNSAGTRRDVKRVTPDQYGWGSNWGEKLELMAPGYLYVSTHYGGDSEYYDGVARGTFGGTSCSCPCLAGCFGLLKSAFPEMTALEMWDRMKYTADDLYTPGHDDQSGWGRVNVWRAIYGSEPNEAMFDGNGHIPVAPDGEWFYDNIFDVSTSADYDFEDIFVIEADTTGLLVIDMDTITTGEDLDMELYLSPDLGVVAASSTGPNGDQRPFETIGAMVAEGQKLYARVFSPEEFNTSNFRIRAYSEPREWWIEWESLAPVFILDGSPAVPMLKLEIYTNLLITLDKIRAYIAGDIPIGLVNHLRLYEDTNGSGSWEAFGDTAVGSVVPSDGGVNQVVFDELYDVCTYNKPLRYFIVADVGPNELGYNVEFGIGLRTYKDVAISQKTPLRDDPFPIFTDYTVVGQDHVPPAWDDTVGLQFTESKYESAVLYWNNATDILSQPTHYNVYWDDEFPPEISTGSMIEGISYWWGGEDYDHAGKVTGLENGQTYWFLIRAEDSLGNEDLNEIWLDATPDANADPANPEVIGELDLPGDSWEVWAHDKIAYLASGDAGISIVDCTDADNPVLIDSYPAEGCYGIQYYDAQDYVYASCYDGLIIVDPDAAGGPSLVGSYNAGTEALDVYVADGICYLGNYSGRLYIIDISDPSAPVHKSDISLGNNQGIYGIAAREGFAWCCTSSAGVKVVNATDPENPSVAKTLTLQNYTYEITLHGDYALVTNWWNHRLYVLGISDPANTSNLGNFNFSSGNGAGVAARDAQYAYFGRYPNAVWSVDWSDFGDIHQVGATSTDGADGLFFDGEYLYAAENTDGLKIIL